MLTKIKVFGYHFPCRDGHVAKICKIYHDSQTKKDKNDKNEITVEWKFNPSNQMADMKKLINYCDQTGYIIDTFISFDVAFNVPAIEYLLSESNVTAKIQIFDHHKTSKEAFETFSNTQVTLVHDMSECGASLAWKYYFPSVPLPTFIKHIRIRDNWEFDTLEAIDLKSMFVNEYLFATAPDYNSTEEWFSYFTKDEAFFEMAASSGESLIKIKNIIVKTLQRGGAVYKINEHRVFVCNVPIYISELGDKMAHDVDADVDYVLMWRYNESCGEYWVSLRSRKNGTDVSMVAKRYGGGGHASAAGFTIKYISDILPHLGKPGYYKQYVIPVILGIESGIEKIIELSYRAWNFTFQRTSNFKED